MQREHDVVRKYLRKNVLRMKGSSDVKHSLTHYREGYLGIYATKSGQLDVVPKLKVNFQGSYLVLDRLWDLD